MSTATIDMVAPVDAHEGAVYAADEHALYFTTVPRPAVAIKRLDLATRSVSVLVEDANRANGMTLGLDGRLVVCEQGSHEHDACISAIDRATGVREVLVDRWRGLRLNSPNDVVVRSDGTIWFTDPSYGHLQGFRPEPEVGDYVYRYDPVADDLSVVADSFDMPNGLAFSRDERVLYVTDSGANQEPGSYHVDRPHRIVAFDVVGGHHLAGERLFAVVTPGFPDGLKVDSAGRVYASSFSGVQVFSPDGERIDEIPVPGVVNFAWAGEVLYITTDEAVWAAGNGV
jgi:gluconolactonase